MAVGVWLSLVEHLHGVQGVASSNPATPTLLSARRGLAAAAAALLLAGCGARTSPPGYDSAEEKAELRHQVAYAIARGEERRARLQDVADAIKLANPEICGDFIEPHLGLELWSLPALGRLEEVAREVYEQDHGLDGAARIRRVAPSSAAAAAGLRRGDELLAIGGEPAAGSARGLRAAARRLAANPDYAPVTLRLRRGGRELERVVKPRAACRSEVGIAPGAEINAYADGSRVGVARGMLNFVDSDEELAFVVGHEIAHNVMDHVDIMRGNMLIGTILGGLLDIAAASGGVYTGGAISSAGMEAGRLAKSAELEAEADYIGLYMLHNAGFDISGGADFWRRMGAEGGSLYASSTHPTTPQRFIAMRKTIAEIQGKAARGEPTLPTPADGR